MRLLALWSGAYGGGARKRFVELTGGLSRRGHEVWLLAPEPFREMTDLRFLPVRAVGGFPAALKKQYLLATPVRGALRRLRPHLAYAFGHDAGALSRACPPLACPFVVFVRGEELVTVNNPHIPFRGVPLLGPLATEAYARAFVRWTRSMYRKAAAIVFQHRRQRLFYISHRMVSPEQAERWPLLPNNCNPTWMQGHPQYALVGPPHSVIVGNLYWNKGFAPLFAAFRDVRAAWPQARLLVLGDGPDRGSIRAAARKVGGVTFHGCVDNVLDFLLGARVFVFPSQVEGGSPNAALEAVEMGMPMLCSSEVAYMVGKAYPGLFGDADQLATLWRRALAEDAFCRRLMEASLSLRRRYRFDWVGEAERLLKQVARENGGE